MSLKSKYQQGSGFSETQRRIPPCLSWLPVASRPSPASSGLWLCHSNLCLPRHRRSLCVLAPACLSSCKDTSHTGWGPIQLPYHLVLANHICNTAESHFIIIYQSHLFTYHLIPEQINLCSVDICFVCLAFHWVLQLMTHVSWENGSSPAPNAHACSVVSDCCSADCSRLDSPVRGISQLEQVAISPARGSSQPRNRTRVSSNSCAGRQIQPQIVPISYDSPQHWPRRQTCGLSGRPVRCFLKTLRTESLEIGQFFLWA